MFIRHRAVAVDGHPQAGEGDILNWPEKDKTTQVNKGNRFLNRFNAHPGQSAVGFLAVLI